MRNRSCNQLIVSICLLIVGIILLLINLGVISWGIKELFVVSLPFIIGILGLWSVFKKRNLFLGSFFIIYSSLLILNQLNIFRFVYSDVWKLWPLLIIYLGFSIFIKKDKVKIHFSSDLPGELLKDEQLAGKKRGVRGFSIGDVSFKSDNWALEPLELYNTIGDYYIDFSKAFIPEKETPVVVNGWIGDVKMIIPEDLPVVIDAYIKIGDIRIFKQDHGLANRHLFYKTPGYDEATRKLKITIHLSIGSIRIDRV